MIQKWVGFGVKIAALIAALWAGFLLLYGLKTEVNRLTVLVDYMDSTVVKNANYRKRQICKANGYIGERFEQCPLLRMELGGEEIEPAEDDAPALPEISP